MSFVSYSGVRSTQGPSEVNTRIVGDDVFNSVILRQFTSVLDRTETNRFHSNEVTVGMKHQWRAGSAFTAAARYEALEQTVEVPASSISCEGFNLAAPPFSILGARVNRRTRNPFDVFDVQIQQATRVGRHQLIVGHQSYTLNKGTDCSETYHFADSEETFDNTSGSDGHDSGSQTYLRDEIQVAPWLHASAGIAYQRVSYDDTIAGETFQIGRWSPRVGIAARLTPTTLLRVAAFRQLHINLFNASIAPPTISGFVVARNEFPTTTRDEYSVSLEHSARRAFVAIRGFFRDATVPFLKDRGSFVPEADASGAGGGVYANWIAHDRVTIFAEDLLQRFESERFDRYDNLARVGVNAIHPRGIFVRLTGAHVTQRFANAVVVGLPRSGFTLVDLRLSYEFAAKRALLSLDVSNAFEQRFEAVIENLSIDNFLPRRRVVAALRWRLW